MNNRKMSSVTLLIYSVLVASILSSLFVSPVNAQQSESLFSFSTSTADERDALVAEINDSSSRALFENLSLLNNHQYDGARMVAILQSHYPGAFDDFTFLYTYNSSSSKTRLEMYGNGSDLKAIGGDDVEQIAKIASLFGFHVTGFSQFAKTQELIMVFETP